MGAREKKPYDYIAPRIVEHKDQDYTVAYINISTSNYAGNWVLVEQECPIQFLLSLEAPIVKIIGSILSLVPKTFYRGQGRK